MHVLVVNAGSSSLKASLIEVGKDEPIAAVNEAWQDDRAGTVDAAIGELRSHGEADAVAHRVVHGGPRFTQPALIDDDVLGQIEAVTELAPLHNRPALEAIRAARSALPSVPHIACFDTAFHSTMPEVAWRYPVPHEWAAAWGIRRFGFHGLSVEWSVTKAAEVLGVGIGEVNIVVAHLGSGCSATAVRNGQSAWTSMGFTPLEGLMMGTRSGSIDPGIPLQLIRTGRLTADEVEAALERQSGLRGVSGSSADMRELRAAADSGDQRAQMAIDMFVASTAQWIAAGLTWVKADALIFTGGIGENDERTRSAILDRLPVETQAIVVRAREDLVMAGTAASLVDTRNTQKH
jgi:acetate kinase